MTRKEKFHFVCFGILFVVAVGFLVWCIVYQDDRLYNAVICVCGTAALLIQRIYWWRKAKG